MIQLNRRQRWINALAAIQAIVITIGIVLIMSTTQEHPIQMVGPLDGRADLNSSRSTEKNIKDTNALQKNMSNGALQYKTKTNDNTNNHDDYNAGNRKDYVENKHKNYNENNRNIRKDYNESIRKDFTVNNRKDCNTNNRKDCNTNNRKDHNENYRNRKYNVNNPNNVNASYREDFQGSTHDLRWSPEMDVIEETIVMSDAPLKDLREMADVDKSVFHIIDPKPSYSIGDEVKIAIELYDGFGRRRQTGGDRLMVRMFEQPLEASAIGYVLDHDNGTYTAIIKCLWKGNPMISIALDFPRQVIRVLYEQLYKNVKTLYVYYKNNERQSCQPTMQYLDATKAICDMADYNGGMSWFCQAPENNGTSCHDVKIFNDGSLRDQLVGELKRILVERKRTFFPTFKIVVRGNVSITQAADRKLPCYLYNITRLWFLPSPVGYFMHKEWKIVHCKPPSKNVYPVCLRDKRVILFGDSTSLQWFEDLRQRFNATSFKGPIVEGGVRYTDFSAYAAPLNLTLEMVYHSLPGNVNRDYSTSIGKHVLSFMDKKNMIFVIHIYIHIIRYHHSIWRDRIRHIKHAIEIYLEFNNSAKFLIKGGNAVDMSRIRHYTHYLYRRILLEEFKGLYDNVVYLDTADASMAADSTDVHPDSIIVTGMVNQMLAYICH